MFRYSPGLALLVWLLLGWCTVWAQPPAPQPGALPSVTEGPVQPDTISARKAAIQARLEALSQAGLPQPEREAVQSTLQQMLQVLTSLEEAWQQRAQYAAQLKELPQRVPELVATRQKLIAQPPPRLPAITEEVSAEYEARLQTSQQEIHDLQQQAAAREIRLTAITRALEQAAAERAQLEEQLQAMRGQTTGQLADLEMALLSLRLQLLHATAETLQVESEWLTQRRLLDDALLSLAQARRDQLQQALDAITQALGTTLQREQALLQREAERLRQQLSQDTPPAETRRLTAELEAIDIRTTTVDLRQQLSRLAEQVQAEQQRRLQLQQDIDWWRSLVERYAAGDAVAQRLLGAYQRLQRELQRSGEAPVTALERQLRRLTARMLALDDRLYEFDRQTAARLTELTPLVEAMPPEQRQAVVAAVRKALEDQKAALRTQQQVLTEFVQQVTTLLTSHREYRRLLAGSYALVHSNILWLRSAETLSLEVVRDMLRGAVATLWRLRALLAAEQARLQALVANTPVLWLLAIVLLVLLPGGAYWIQQRLQRLVTPALAAPQEEPPGVWLGLLLVCKAAVWPAYLAFLAWLRGQLIPAADVATPELAAALVSGLYVSALILWIALSVRALLQPDGWGERFWKLPPEICRFLRRVITAGCLAALVLLVPHHILLTAPGQGVAADESLALARGLFLVFQMVLLVLVGVVSRRHSPLLVILLARSRQAQGFWWRFWPLIFLLLLGGVLAIIALHVLGYLYAARYIWSRLLISLGLILICQFLLGVLMLRALRQVFGVVSRRHPLQPANLLEEAGLHRLFTVTGRLVYAALVVLTVALLLEIWGVSITGLLFAPLTRQLLRRVVISALTVGLVISVIQASKALTAYVLRPRTIRGGRQWEAGRKLRTLAPLLQTVLRVVAIFLAALVILEQLGVATGPLLTGVGIFGLAVGFASQSLIKDVINGLFMLFEDSLSVGDMVTLRGTSGQVEKITLRTVTIRDGSGNVHVIPNGTIDLVTKQHR